MSNRAKTGIRGLDALIGGGFPAHRAILVYGEPGTGKSTFGLQFLAQGAADREPGILVSVDEKPRHVLEDAAAFSWNLDEAITRGTLTMLDASPYFTVTRSNGNHACVDVRVIAGDLTQQIRKAKARRLVIDSFTSLLPPHATRWEAYDYLRSLIQSLEDNLECTILLTCRPPKNPDPQGSFEAAETLASGVIQLQVTKADEGYTRTCFVKKMRGTPLELAEYAFNIEAGNGLTVTERV